MKAEKKIVLILRTVDSAQDARVLLISKAATINSLIPIVVDWSDKKYDSNLDFKVQRFYAPRMFQQGILKTFHLRISFQFFALKTLFQYRRKITAVHCCDVDSCFLVFLFFRILKINFVLDILDLQSESILKLNNFMKIVLNQIEKIVIKQASKVIVVDKNRIPQIQNLVPREDIFIINNITEKLDQLHEHIIKIKPEKSIDVIYIGNLSEDRGIQCLLSAVNELPNVNFVIGGYGLLVDLIESSLQKNLTYLGKVNYNTAMEYISKSKIMVATYDSSIPNNRLSSPNKIFESMALGIPIIVSRDTSIDKFVSKNNFGLVIDYNNLENLIVSIRKLLEDLELYNQMCDNAFKIYKNFSFKNALSVFTTIYKDFI
jgi:glycosyltransferase involved in cell wall biosynthesis